MTERRWAHRHRLTVRFSDCDLLGHVNNAVYLTYFEECRVAWWRELGGSTTLPGGIGVILVRAECNYRAPALLSEELEIRLAVTAIGTSSVSMEYEIENVSSGRLLADGKTVVVAFDYEAQKTVPVPPDTRAKLLGE